MSIADKHLILAVLEMMRGMMISLAATLDLWHNLVTLIFSEVSEDYSLLGLVDEDVKYMDV